MAGKGSVMSDTEITKLCNEIHEGLKELAYDLEGFMHSAYAAIEPEFKEKVINARDGFGEVRKKLSVQQATEIATIAADFIDEVKIVKDGRSIYHAVNDPQTRADYEPEFSKGAEESLAKVCKIYQLMSLLGLEKEFTEARTNRRPSSGPGFGPATP